MILNKIRRANLSEIAYEYIKNNIISGEYKAEELITENKIAAAIQMSRTPVRRALIQLEAENYVRTIDGIGTLVVGLSLSDLEEIYDVRKALEVQALRTSINRITSQELEKIEQEFYSILEQYDSGLEVNSEDLVWADKHIHDLIVDRSANRYIRKLMSDIEIQIERYKSFAYAETETGREGLIQHLELLGYIKERDFEKAKVFLRKHIDWSYEELSKVL